MAKKKFFLEFEALDIERYGKKYVKKSVTISQFEYNRLIDSIMWLEAIVTDLQKKDAINEVDFLNKKLYEKLSSNARKSVKVYFKWLYTQI